MRVWAFAVAICFGVSAVPGFASPGTPSREEALVALCRVWNAVRFMHPGLIDETDARWDDALLAAAPIVEGDPAKLRDAAASMLATLHDPLTTLDVDRKDGLITLPSAEDRDGVRLARVNGYPTAANAAEYVKALSVAVAVPATDRALIVDLRSSAPPSFQQLDSQWRLWTQTGFVTHLTAVPIPFPATAQRYFLGFPSEDGAPNGSYREGRETTGPVRMVAPAKDARAVPVAFLTDANAVVPDDAIALERAGRAAIFSSDESAGILPGDVQILDAGSGLTVVLRTAAPMDIPTLRSGGVDAALAWVRDPQQATPKSPQVPAATPIAQRYGSASLPDDAHRILAAFRMWGAIAYLFPYQNLMHDDWDAALRNGLADLRGVKAPLEYEFALSKMYAHIHDSHGYIGAPAMSTAYAAAPPFLARDVEGHPTIVRVDPVAAKRDGFAVGDVIEEVDGETVAARIARLRPYLPSSTEQSFREVFFTGTGRVSLLAGLAGSSMTLRVRGADGKVRVVHTVRSAAAGKLRERTRPVVDVLAGNVGYADLARLTVPQVGPMLEHFASTRAIVFDLRGYPRGTAWPIAQHFIGGPTRVALFRTPVRRVAVSASNGREGAEFLTETRDFYQLLGPQAPRYRKPVVVVIDARAISQSEHTGLFLTESAHARFVGEPTTGANGDVTRFFLPGGISANFTGQAVFHANGAQLQRVGLIPDVRVAQTLGGLRRGDDELLAAGLREALRLAHADAVTVRGALVAETARERGDAQAQLRLLPAPPPVAANAAPLPDAFQPHGVAYDGGHDTAMHHADGRTIVLRATSDAPSGFGTMTEQIPVEPYRGKRVRVSGYIRSADARSASFWLRVDGPSGVEAFDNMNDRALTGTRDWTPFQIVLDVPTDASSLVGGLLLVGRGTVWADDMRIDVVGTGVPTTGSM
jgi:C-terminal processing protease CtpA/Prc